jgi:hypothetical protein
LAECNKQSVPPIIEKCIEYIESSGNCSSNIGLTSQGIYRLSGNAATVQKHRVLLNQSMFFIDQENEDGLFEATMDVNVIAALIKCIIMLIQYFSERFRSL